MKYHLFLILLLLSGYVFGQKGQDTTTIYKKCVLESPEINFVSSYYQQDGDNASVTGGIGTEKLNDLTPTLIIAIPLNADDVLTLDAGISAYSSASSSNLNPFYASGASRNGYDEEDDEEDDEDWQQGNEQPAGPVTGSPWMASSGASGKDVWGGIHVNYSHSSDDRNKIWEVGGSFAVEFDYLSIGFSGGYSRLFNEKNTELGIKAQVYLDTWFPKYPTELDSYLEAGNSLHAGFFNGVDILNQQGDVVDKSGATGDVWSPVENFTLLNNKKRNSYSMSFSISQVLSKKAQGILLLDVVQQNGWLANPMQRVYFADRENYYIGDASFISSYTSHYNTGVFQLADDIERLPETRFKLPMGVKLNYYVNENIVLRTYYRYYLDSWGLESHTASIEVPLKFINRLTFLPFYRFYSQGAAEYFAPFERHLSSEKFYTSDYDLSAFTANQYGLGISYTDIFTNMRVWRFGLKNIDLKINRYHRNSGLNAFIVSWGCKLVME